MANTLDKLIEYLEDCENLKSTASDLGQEKIRYMVDIEKQIVSQKDQLFQNDEQEKEMSQINVKSNNERYSKNLTSYDILRSVKEPNFLTKHKSGLFHK